MKLLVAVDFSPSSETIIAEIEARPWPRGTEAIVLHVIDVIGLGSGVMDVGTILEEERQQARQLVDSIAARLSAAGIKAGGDMIDASPRESIADYAKQCAADFIIIGSHGHGGLVRFLLGSVAKSILRSASCSVEIIRSRAHVEGASKSTRVLLATDGSEYSQAAARSIASRPWPADTEFKVVSIAEVPPFCLPPYSKHREDSTLDAIRDAIIVTADETVDSARAILMRSELEASALVSVGDPRTGILDEAAHWAASLIVVGSHGKRGADGVAPGTVAEIVALHAHCSVEVIRSPE